MTDSPLGKIDPGAIAEFWQMFLGENNLDPSTPVPEAWYFGHSVEMANELLDVVINGPKRATTGMLVEYEAENEPVPKVGDRTIVCDGQLAPRLVLTATDVRVGPLSSVDDQFAWDEGEGDRSRTYWLEVHTRVFQHHYELMGLDFHADIPAVFQRFEVNFQR